MANQLLSALRNEGLATRAKGVSTLAEVKAQLETGTWDMLVCYEGDASLKAGDVLKLRDRMECDTPLIFIGLENSAENPAQILALGACEALVENEDERLLLRMKREISLYREARKQRRQQLAYRELEQRHQLLLNSTMDAFSYIHEGMHVYCNPGYLRLFGHDDGDTLLKTPLLDLVSQRDARKLKDLLSRPVNSETRISLEAKTLDDTPFPADFVFTPVLHNDQATLQLAVKPAAGNSAYSAQADNILHRDLLTRLQNRERFSTTLESAIGTAIRQNIHSSLLLVRIKQFVDIESAIGKSQANMVLIDISRFLQQAIKKTFTAGRLDRFEFGLILHDSKPEEALQLSAHITSQVTNQLTSTPLPALQLSCSVGIAAINGNALDATDLLARARANLLHSSREIAQQYPTSGSGEFRIGESPDPDVSEIALYLQKALDAGLFTLLFQPIVSLNDRGPHGYEVLSRMLDTEGNEIRPEVFLPAANLMGLGEKLDRVIIAQVLTLLKNNKDPDLTLIVNITSNSLVSKTFLPWLSEELQKARVSTDLLVCQFSEINLYHSPEHVITFCQGLDELNIKKSIGHFGSALSPFEHLPGIRPAFLKLDENLFRDILYSPQQKDNVRSLIEQLHEYELKVVAPRVEDMDVVPVLWELGVDFVQGYCLQGPTQEMDYEFFHEQEITLAAFNPS
ncbi:MAG: EAL domain-containing protein [Pseudomonadales bacterium]|nr:EAL domain-containing protein [Pseudomonadales bacterium]